MLTVITATAYPAETITSNIQSNQKTLVIGSEQNFPPFATGMTDSTAGGFTVDFWKAVADEAGLKYTIRVLPFRQILQEFKEGRIDVLINLAISDERRQFAEFSLPHVVVNGAIFVRKDKTDIQSEDDLSGKSIIVLNRDLGHDYAISKGWSKQLVLVDTIAKGLKLLSSGKHDAMLLSKLVGMQSLEVLGLTDIKPLKTPAGFSQKFAFAVPKGQVDLLSKINEAIVITNTNGIYTKIYDKWFGVYESKQLKLRDILKYISPLIALFLVISIFFYYRRQVERESAVSVLKKSEERWQFALEGSGDGVWDWNIQADQVIYSKRWKEMLGYTEDEVGTGLDEWSSRVHPEDMPRVMADLQPHLDGQTATYINEHRMRCKDGSYKWVLDRGLVFARDAAGNPLRVVGTHTDITERKQSETALIEKEEHLQLSLKSSKQYWFELNLQTGDIRVSPDYPDVLGYDPAEFHSNLQNWKDNIHPDDYDAVMTAFRDCLRSDSAMSLEYRRRKQDGSWLWFQSTAEVTEKGPMQEPLRMTGIHADITERKLSEEKLKLAASVFTHARESITISDATGEIIDINDTFTQITGYSREEAIGKNSRILQSGRQSAEFYVDMWKELVNKGYWDGEIWNRRKNGEVYAEMKSISAVYDKNRLATHYVGLGSDITPMKEHQAQLEHIAHYDILTNLPNRSLLTDRLSQSMVQSQRHNNSLAVVFLDLDGFKDVNDTHGHDIGDELLIIVSQRMKEALREGDTLARIGGDEFIAVLIDLTNIEDCQPVLERLLIAASETIQVGEVELHVSASIGVTLYPQDKVDADQLMRHADQAMYLAKQAGKNRYHLFDTAQDDAIKIKRENLAAIQSAIDNEQFLLHYQPKINMRTGTIIGLEALIRWQHPEQGLLQPNEFLPIIENHSMGIKLGEWVLDTVLTQISLWQEMGLKLTVSTSVNIGAVQLQQNDFVEHLTTLLAAHPNVNPRYLELEVLETTALDDVDHISTVMNACMALGVSFSLDDFGTGYSSLTYLRRLPAGMIKIDQSFVRDMLVDPDDLAIVEGVIALAKSFKRDVIAEGVETIEHATALLQLGCELAQGYGIARPMSAADIPAWINSWKPDDSWHI